MNGSIILGRGTRRTVCTLVFAVLYLLATGCYRASQESGPEGPPKAAAVAPAVQDAAKEETDRAKSTVSPLPPPVAGSSPEGAAPQVPAVSSPEPSPAPSHAEIPPAIAPPLPAGEPSQAGVEPPEASKPEGTKDGLKKEEQEVAPVAAVSPPAQAAAPATPADAGQATVVAMLPRERMFAEEGPFWARSEEDLVYKVEFLGVTMGYARFSFLGKVLLSGKEAYHLRVRAWTSDVLAMVYPMDDTIDYYLDVQTITPLRQERTKRKKEDDVAIFDQEEGTIVYRDKKDGKVIKKVDVVPHVYDPVSAAYYFRSRDPGMEQEALTMYAGRKLWDVSAKVVGSERIRTERGEFDTVIIEPVVVRKGGGEKKKDIRMWMTRDEQHVPVRMYAKFKKIRTWTLVGELLPDRQGG
jgi:hypothetical protein